MDEKREIRLPAQPALDDWWKLKRWMAAILEATVEDLKETGVVVHLEKAGLLIEDSCGQLSYGG